MDLTYQQWQRIQENPLRLITDGYMRVVSDRRIESDGRFVRLPCAQESVFRPNYNQRCVLWVVERCRREGRPCRIIGVKARRDGMSEIASRIIAAKACVRQNPLIATLTTTDKQLDQINRKMLVSAFQKLPQALRPLFSREFTHPLYFARVGNPVYGIPDQDECAISLISAEQGISAGIGSACEYAWITEYAYFKKGDEVMEGFLPSLMDTPESFLMKESVALGSTTLHAKEFTFSWDLQGRANPGPNSKYFKWNSNAPEVAMFFPWYYGEERALPLVKGVTTGQFLADLDEYEKEILYMRGGLLDFAREEKRRLGFKSDGDAMDYCVQQLHWRRAYCISVPDFDYARRSIPLGMAKAGVNSRIAMYRTIPSTVDEAFTGDDIMAFPDSVKREHQVNLRPPLKGFLLEDGRFIEDANGWLSLWFADSSFTGEDYVAETRRIVRESDGFAPRLVYVMASDFANGDFEYDEKSDKSSSTAWTWQRHQVAEINVREKIHLFEDKLHRLYRFLSANLEYRGPFEIPESSGPGRHHAQSITDPQAQSFRDHYNRVFFSRRMGNVQNREFTDKPGFEASIHKMNQVAWVIFQELTMRGGYVMRSAVLFEQVINLARGAHDVLQAKNKGASGVGSKDDVADTAKMALFYINELENEFGGCGAAFSGFADNTGQIVYRHPTEFDPQSKEADAYRRSLRQKGTEPWWSQQKVGQDDEKPWFQLT